MKTKNGFQNILLIEDNQADIELAQKALDKNNVLYKLFVVHDGEEALDFLFRQGKFRGVINPLPNLIFLDLKLPKIDGLEVLEQIKNTEKLKRIPIVVLTTSGRERDVLGSYDLGANSFVQKPVDFNEFHRTLKIITDYWINSNTPPTL